MDVVLVMVPSLDGFNIPDKTMTPYLQFEHGKNG